MTRAICSSFLLSFVLSMSAAQSESTYTATEILELREAAETAYSDRNAKAATALFLQLTKEFPGDAEMWFGLSRAYEWSDDFPKAIGAAERPGIGEFVFLSSLVHVAIFAFVLLREISE